MPDGDMMARATAGVRARSGNRSITSGSGQKLLMTLVNTLSIVVGSLAS
jgi:hypothetical protein